MIRCALFDLDGTLYDFDLAAARAMDAACAAARHLVGIPEDETRADYKRYLDEQRSIAPDQAGYHSRLIRFQRMLEDRALPLHFAVPLTDVYWKAFLEATEPFPDAAETLDALRALGLRIGLGTNMTAEMQFRKLERLGLIDRFDFIVSSEEAAAEKPLPAFFALCVRKAGCPANECLFVGDNREMDALGASAAGLRGVWLAPDAAGRAAHPETPSVMALRELPALVKTGF